VVWHWLEPLRASNDENLVADSARGGADDLFACANIFFSFCFLDPNGGRGKTQTETSIKDDPWRAELNREGG
jgi:hypothetical protein